MPPKRSLKSDNCDVKIKRSRKSVTLETKLEVMKRIEAGEKIVKICKALGLAKSTVQSIRDNKAQIKAYAQSAAPLSVSKLTRQRSSIMEKMETFLSLWIEESNQWNMPMSQVIIQEKAISIFENLKRETNEDVTFQASRGWFDNFKKRHILHPSANNIKMKGEVASVINTDTAQHYPKILKTIVKNGTYVPEQVFNVEETGLYWKRMPERTFVSGSKVSKEQLTLLLGGNAAGDFKLKPLLIYFSESPKAFKGLDKSQLPVIWRSHKKAWMTKILFEEWFKKHFCPEVQKYLQSKDLSNKVLLLLNNAPGHPVNLPEISENVEVEFLPKNTAAQIQPMDQGAIAIFKAYYLRRIFRQLVDVTTNSQSSIKDFWKNYNIKDAVENIGESWMELQPITMNHMWGKIWPECVTTNDGGDSLTEIQREILQLGNELGFNELKEFDVINLLNADRKPLSNEELFKLETETIPDDRQLTSQTLLKAFFYFEQGMKILNENDPDEDRSREASRGINTSLNCYKELLIEKKREAKQQINALDHFLKPYMS